MASITVSFKIEDIGTERSVVGRFRVAWPWRQPTMRDELWQANLLRSGLLAMPGKYAGIENFLNSISSSCIFSRVKRE